MAELIGRLRPVRISPPARRRDLGWLGVAVAGAVAVGWTLTLSVQAACALVLVVAVVGLHQYDRRWGIAAMFVLWFVSPYLRRVFGLETGYVDSDPLALAPYLAIVLIAGLEFVRVQVSVAVRRLLLVVAAGFAIGMPVGLLASPTAALFAFLAYVAGVSAAVLGFNEPGTVQGSTLRRVLLVAVPVVAAYAITQRVFGLTAADQAWLDATGFDSIGAQGEERVFGTLNSPGALAPLLALSLLCHLSVARHRAITALGAGLVTVALALTFVRSSWVALMVAGLAHVVATDGRSARAVFGTAGVIVVLSIALSPVSNAAQSVVDRFNTIDEPVDTSATARRATFRETLPRAVAAPLGHGIGSAGEPSRLSAEPDLRTPDNGYLGLVYQVGPIGFLLVIAVIGGIVRAAWRGARARAPGSEMRQLLLAMLVYLLVLLTSGDAFYGVTGAIFWFIAGQVLAFRYGSRPAPS